MNFYGLVMKIWGWKADSGAAPEEKCVILGVPHTSIPISTTRAWGTRPT